MAQAYKIIFYNKTSQTTTFCCFHKDIQTNIPDAFTLAWMTRLAPPKANTTMQWAMDYNFVWGETGLLKPGIIFRAAQNLPTSLIAQNRVTLTNDDGIYQFTDQVTTPPQGSLIINMTNTMPPNMAATGIGMSGEGIMVAPTQPNMILIFTPRPSYWIAFGDYQMGQTLDLEEINNAVQVIFPPNIYTMYATLNADESWTLSQYKP